MRLLPSALAPKPLVCAMTASGLRVFVGVSEQRLRVTTMLPPPREQMRVSDLWVVGSSFLALERETLVAFVRDDAVQTSFQERVGVAFRRQDAVLNVCCLEEKTSELRADGSAYMFAGMNGMLTNDEETSFLVLGSRGVVCLQRRRPCDRPFDPSNVTFHSVACFANHLMDAATTQTELGLVERFSATEDLRGLLADGMLLSLARTLRPLWTTPALGTTAPQPLLERLQLLLRNLETALEPLRRTVSGRLPELSPRNRSVFSLLLFLQRCNDAARLAGHVASPAVFHVAYAVRPRPSLRRQLHAAGDSLSARLGEFSRPRLPAVRHRRADAGCLGGFLG